MGDNVKKFINIILILSLVIPVFIPLMDIKADNSYEVVAIKSDGTVAPIGSFSNYNDAKNSMFGYNSTIDNVAVIKRNGVIVNATYGIFRPNTSSSTINIYTDYGTGYMAPSYSSDTLFLDYDPNTNMIQIMVSGVKAWVNAGAGIIYPISYITNGSNLSYDINKKYVKILYANGIRLREGPGIDFKQVGCNGATTCGESQGGIWTDGGAIYEWLNYGSVTNDGTNDWYQVNINGNIGYIANNVADRDLEEFIPSQGLKQDFQTYYYVNNQGELYHQYYATASSSGTWTNRLGKAPLYLKQNTRYYSFDGNYFYDDFLKMVNDLRANNYSNAVNKLPYYNYYQYLPVRTQTNYNADNLNIYIGYDGKIDRDKYYYYDYDKGKWEYRPEWTSPDWYSEDYNKSMLYNEGSSFIESQEKYGVNAAQTLALAINESGWGRSYMAVRQNNIFGHGAFDSAPDEYAAGYATVKDGIVAHAFKYIAGDYDNPISGAHYYGGHYGNKLSGNNVSYASDAYWGEKMAGNYYSLDRYFGFQDFNQRLILGIKQGSEAAPVYSAPSTQSNKYYNLKNIPNIPVTILDEVVGEEINGNNVWYKIQSDLPIDASRNLVDLNLGEYNFDTSYAYIHSSYIYKEAKEPAITANDVTLNSGSNFNPLDGVSAYDAWDGDVTDKIKVVSNNVDTNIGGTYVVTYEVIDSENNKATKTINVTILSSKPSIVANDKTVTLGNSFDPLSGVTANDNEDGDITSKIMVVSNNVDINKIGNYQIKYSVTDSDNNTTTLTINVDIVSPNYKEIDNSFYFESLNIIDNKLHIKGFITLKGVDNSLNNNIRYRLSFVNEETNEEIYQDLTRITNKNDMPFIIDGENNLDYTYSWFEGDITIDILKNGNYSLYLFANDSSNISAVSVSNVFGKAMPTTFTEKSKSALIRSNYESRDATIQLFVRDNLIGSKTGNSRYNISNEYSTITFKNNNLVIRGASHIIGGDYSANADVTRTLVFENIDTFDTYSFDIGSITNGDYTVELRVPDGFDKTRSWFETNIDLSSLPNGTYTINIATSSNISDFGELQDIFSRKISASLTNNGKDYSFSVNKNKRFRIELTVKDA